MIQSILYDYEIDYFNNRFELDVKKKLVFFKIVFTLHFEVSSATLNTLPPCSY